MSRNRFTRPSRHRARRKLFVIATEGKRTEKIYFEVFNNDRFRKNVQICILPTGKGDSDPANVLKRLRRYVNEKGVEDGDELWVVVDCDSWGEQVLDKLCRECNQAQFHVAVSNPCFELWLLLHQEHPPRPQPQSAKICEKALEKLLGHYDKADYDAEKLVPYMSHAVTHAHRLDLDPNRPWPVAPATRVYRLVMKLLEDET